MFLPCFLAFRNGTRILCLSERLDSHISFTYKNKSRGWDTEIENRYILKKVELSLVGIRVLSVNMFQ
jgi:hypothetical protein